MEAARRSTAQEREREKLSWLVKMSEDKEQKRCLEEEIVDTPCESNVNTVFERHVSSEIIH